MKYRIRISVREATKKCEIVQADIHIYIFIMLIIVVVWHGVWEKRCKGKIMGGNGRLNCIENVVNRLLNLSF